MLYVGESAKTKIDQIKADQNMPEDFFVRVSVTSGGCSGNSLYRGLNPVLTTKKTFGILETLIYLCFITKTKT